MTVHRQISRGRTVKISGGGRDFSAELNVPYLDAPDRPGKRYFARGTSDAAVWFAIKRQLAEDPPSDYSPEWHARLVALAAAEEERKRRAAEHAILNAEADGLAMATMSPVSGVGAPTVFITNANARRLIEGAELRRVADTALKDIYPADLSIFSKGERRWLAAVKRLYTDFDSYMGEIYSCGDVASKKLKVIRRKTPPAYHLSATCDRMLADYENFAMPPEIEARGPAEEERFRGWFEANEELRESDPARFQLRLWASFGVKISLRAITLPNSGGTTPTDALIASIHERVVARIERAMMKKSKSPVLRCHGDRAHAPPASMNDEGRAELAGWKDEKGDIKRDIVSYLKARFNPTLEFPGHLLEQAGFVPCSECAAHLRKQRR